MTQHCITLPKHEHPGAPGACRIGPIVASSAILGKDPDTGVMPDDAETQSRNAFINMKRLLAAYDLDEHDVVKLNIFVKDVAYREASLNAWYECYPDENRRPARHSLTVPINIGLIQLEFYAVVSDG
jgi:2-iminobutanoate/2-iminopropanoate deaminase